MQFSKKFYKHILYLGLDPTRYQATHPQTHITHLPLIAIQPYPFSQVRAFFAELATHSHVLFTSQTAISLYLAYGQEAELSWEALKSKIYLSIGKATKSALETRGLSVAHTAIEETGEGVIALLEKLFSPPDQIQLFFPHSALSRPLITEHARSHEWQITAFPLYTLAFPKVILPDLSHFDSYIFTSPSTVEAFFALNPAPVDPKKCHPIGPVTAASLAHILKCAAHPLTIYS